MSDEKEMGLIPYDEERRLIPYEKERRLIPHAEKQAKDSKFARKFPYEIPGMLARNDLSMWNEKGAYVRVFYWRTIKRD